MRIEPEQLNQLLRPIFGPDDKQQAVEEGRVKAKGLPAGPGAATGRVVFNAPDAVAWAERGEKVLLVRDFTSPDDIRGMDAAQGILTAQGGMTSHAALVARQMGKVCIVGCGALDIDMQGAQLHGRRRDASRRATGSPSTASPARSSSASSTRGRARSCRCCSRRRMKPEEAGLVPLLRRDHGVGRQGAHAGRAHQRRPARPERQRHRLRRRGHRPLPHRAHVLRGRAHHERARDDPRRRSREAREAALAKLLPMQRDDFAGIFRVMGERPVTIRTLDPPLHEFLPHDAEDTAEDRRGARRPRGRGRAPRSRTCTRATRCSVTAAAASASPSRRSRRCRRGRSSRPPAWSRRKAWTCTPRS